MNKRQILRGGIVLWLCGAMCLSSCAAPPCETETTATSSVTTTATTTTTATVVSTTIVTTTTQVPMIEQPAELTAWLSMHALDFASLQEVGCEQLVIVTSEDETCVRFFACVDGQWQEQTTMSATAYVGKNGVTSYKQEGDGCTPRGWYAIDEAFYIHDKPDTMLAAFEITDDTYWVDDPQSVFYNRRVEGLSQQDWNSAEHMIDYEVYRYGFVIAYNTQALPNVGSAIFFHIGDHSTLGCVATDEETVLRYLRELDPAAHPYILIV